MREGPGTQEKDQLEPLLGLGVGLVLHDDDAPARANGLAGLAKDGDEVVDELRWGEADFLRHRPLIACSAP